MMPALEKHKNEFRGIEMSNGDLSELFIDSMGGNINKFSFQS
jgi:hypothetical protein